MPRGSVHTAVELGLFPGFLLATYFLATAEALFPFSLGYLLGVLLSPDLDLFHSRPARRLGIFRFLWWPYARLFPHRGLSHHPLLGPLSRLLYLTGLLALIIWALSLPLPQLPSSWIKPGLIGFWLPQLLHILLDRWGRLSG